MEQIEAIVAEIEREKEAGETTVDLDMWAVLNFCLFFFVTEAERKRSRLAATTVSQAAMASRVSGEGSSRQ